ncbi:sigma 54 modulation/S30EA ribosomal C-terminal domain-containing protein [Streptomyces sp. H27-H1]|uniref:sigma 54 modulation/S30EA ribosomal C-terminal domain-containing protein n=1 Tax=Streptomyces sp. H27-H1 TaxID=2996461 RepID=UPI002271259C|nr:sigma 54 modulation/S30EA ribosomal C-terminal domain-containing protein [Streptomyces sp. H27-H1]MCY0928000.1 sigma 54 modulation/S30EA ribosomal C-terminal domain-containing protein [Streptomyces sp. H27-H1]
MSHLKSRPAIDVLVNKRGPVPDGASEYARAKMLAAIAHVGPPVLAVRAKLTQAANPSASRPSIAQAVVNVNGHPVRAHCAADTMFEAVDLLQERLAARLAGTRQHGGREHRPGRHQPPLGEPRVVRQKAFSLGRQTPEDAVIDMESRHYGFWLFTDSTSGADCVVYRQGLTGGCRVAPVGGGNQQYEAGPLLSVSSTATPECGVDSAVERIRVTGLAFVFFVDSATGRGCVLYQRDDGHYGLISPAR